MGTSKNTDTPFYINFEQQKKRAKDLCHKLRHANKNAIDRFKRHHPQAPNLSAEEITLNFSKLNEAQLVIARELGLPSWAKLKIHISAMTAASQAIKQKQSPPDGDTKTLHIRCGTDLQQTIRAAIFWQVNAIGCR